MRAQRVRVVEHGPSCAHIENARQRLQRPGHGPAANGQTASQEEAPDELDARLRELAQDAWAAYFRDRTEANLRRAQLLCAASYSPERRRKLAQYERRLAGEEAGTDPQHPDLFWRKVWLKLVRPLVTNANGDHRAVARDLIVHMPAPLRVKCPYYPTSEPEFEQAVVKVVAARNFASEIAMWRACGSLDSLRVARAVLRGLGVSKDEAKSLLRTNQCEAWLCESDTF